MARVAKTADGRGNSGTRVNMPRGKVPSSVKTQSDMYRHDRVSAFGNIVDSSDKSMNTPGGSGKS